MRRFAFGALLLALGCGRRPLVPVNTMLWRIDTPWASPARNPEVRTAHATILVFRKGNEYVELHTPLIEQPDKTVYIQSGRPRIVAIGRWQVRGAQITASRERVSPTGQPLCKEPRLTFRINGKSVTGNAGGAGTGDYSPVTRLVSPTFESYVDSARNSSVVCPGL